MRRSAPELLLLLYYVLSVCRVERESCERYLSLFVLAKSLCSLLCIYSSSKLG